MPSEPDVARMKLSEIQSELRVGLYSPDPNACLDYRLRRMALWARLDEIKRSNSRERDYYPER